MRIVKMMIISIVISFSLSAQSDFENWKQQQKRSYRANKKKQDEKFVEFLEMNWKNFETFISEKPDKTPKPVQVPKTEPEKLPEIKKGKLIEKIEVKVEKQQQKNNVYFEVDKEKPVIEINYFGMKLDYNFQDSIDIELAPLNEKRIADFWLKVSNTSYEILLEQLQTQRAKMELNDWGYCILINKIAEKISNGDGNLTKLLDWFLLTKSGFNAKVGFSENDVFLLLPTNNVIYGVSYVFIDELRYYAVSFDEKNPIKISMKTYEQSYPDADDLIDLTIDSTPKIGNSILEKELKFSYDNIDYTIPVKYDASAIEFFRSYPQTELDVYFNAPASTMAITSLAQGFSPILEGRTEAEAANILLRFVQTAFKYKTDGDQFGREKSFFADELLFYPYCDCEDRSILYSLLVGQLLELQVIGLDYPGHIATAVNFSSEVPGDFIVFDQDQFVVCDPTYINANVGMTIPDFKEVQPQVIELAKKR